MKHINEKYYGRKRFTPEYFGPWTEIRDPEDLRNPEFILPGHDKSYLKTVVAKDNVPDIWGKIARDCYFPERCGKVVGFGYDYGDYYLIIEQSDGTESTILMNSHYIVE